MSETIEIAAAAIINSENEMLLVRKRGTVAFMQPGGKIDAGENAVEALLRELHEELSFLADQAEIEHVGNFEEVAANEANKHVRAQIYRIENDGPFHAEAEIDEVRWYPSEFCDDDILAPLTKNKVIPAVGVRT